jgi:transposase
MPKIRHTADIKARAVIRHLQDQIDISVICSELSIHPNVFYRWKKQFLDSAPLAFSTTDKARERQIKRQITELELKIQKKDSIIAELMEEYTNLKKKNGGN